MTNTSPASVGDPELRTDEDRTRYVDSLNRGLAHFRDPGSDFVPSEWRPGVVFFPLSLLEPGLTDIARVARVDRYRRLLNAREAHIWDDRNASLPLPLPFPPPEGSPPRARSCMVWFAEVGQEIRRGPELTGLDLVVQRAAALSFAAGPFAEWEGIAIWEQNATPAMKRAALTGWLVNRALDETLPSLGRNAAYLAALACGCDERHLRATLDELFRSSDHHVERREMRELVEDDAWDVGEQVCLDGSQSCGGEGALAVRLNKLLRDAIHRHNTAVTETELASAHRPLDMVRWDILGGLGLAPNSPDAVADGLVEELRRSGLLEDEDLVSNWRSFVRARAIGAQTDDPEVWWRFEFARWLSGKLPTYSRESPVRDLAGRMLVRLCFLERRAAVAPRGGFAGVKVALESVVPGMAPELAEIAREVLDDTIDERDLRRRLRGLAQSEKASPPSEPQAPAETTPRATPEKSVAEWPFSRGMSAGYPRRIVEALEKAGEDAWVPPAELEALRGEATSSLSAAVSDINRRTLVGTGWRVESPTQAKARRNKDVPKGAYRITRKPQDT